MLSTKVFFPLAQGILTGKYKPGQQPAAGTRGADSSVNQAIGSYLRDDVLTVTQELNAPAEAQGLKLSQLALAWVLRQPGVSAAIIGASRPEDPAAFSPSTESLLKRDRFGNAASVPLDVPRHAFGTLPC